MTMPANLSFQPTLGGAAELGRWNAYGGMMVRFGALGLVVVLTACAAVVGKYGVRSDVDKFQDNEVRVTMTGDVIDADYLGMVANAAQFNPFVTRSKDGEILTAQATKGVTKWLS